MYNKRDTKRSLVSSFLRQWYFLSDTILWGVVKENACYFLSPYVLFMGITTTSVKSLNSLDYFSCSHSCFTWQMAVPQWIINWQRLMSIENNKQYLNSWLMKVKSWPVFTNICSESVVKELWTRALSIFGHSALTKLKMEQNFVTHHKVVALALQ